MSLSKRPSCSLSVCSLLCVLAASGAGAQQAGQALVGSGVSIIAVDLTTGAQSPIAMDSTGLVGIVDLAEDAAGDLVFSEVAGVYRIELPVGATDELLDTGGGFPVGAITTGPTGDILGATTSSTTAAATVVAIDPVSGAPVEVVDAIPGAFVSQIAGVAADAANNLYLTYSSLLELGSGIPVPYSLVSRVPAGSTAPVTIADSRSPQFPNNTSFEYLDFDGMDSLVVSTPGEEVYLVDLPTGNVSELSDDGLVTDVRGITFDTNGDVLVMDGTNGIVRITNPGGVQSVVPNSVVPNASGIIVYRSVPEPGFSGSIAFAVLGLSILRRRAAQLPAPTSMGGGNRSVQAVRRGGN